MHQKAIPFKRGNTIELSMWFGIAPGSGIDSLIGVKPVCRLRPRHAREAVAEFEVHTRPENRLLLTLAAIVNEETRSHRSRPAKKASNADKRRQRALKPHKAEKAAPNGPAAKKAPARPVIGSVDTKWAGRLTKAEFKKLQAQHGSLAAMARHFGISQGTVQATKTKLGL